MTIHKIVRDKFGLLYVGENMLASYSDYGEPEIPRGKGEYLDKALYAAVQCFKEIAEGDAFELDGEILGHCRALENFQEA